MPVTAVQDRSTIDPNTVKAVLGITDASRDGLIDLYLQSAKEAADTYMNNPFLERDPVTFKPVEPEVQRPIPATVKEGLVEYVRLKLAQVNATTAASNGASRTEKVGDLSLTQTTHSVESATGGVSRSDQVLRTVQEAYWRPYRLIGVC